MGSQNTQKRPTAVMPWAFVLPSWRCVGSRRQLGVVPISAGRLLGMEKPAVARAVDRGGGIMRLGVPSGR